MDEVAKEGEGVGKGIVYPPNNGRRTAHKRLVYVHAPQKVILKGGSTANIITTSDRLYVTDEKGTIRRVTPRGEKQ